MTALSCVLILLGQIETVESKTFPRARQIAAVTATVHILNGAEGKIGGSGVVVKKSGPYVYILTAYHVIAGTDNLRVETYSADSYPEPDHVYGSPEVIARAKDIKDLALLRVLVGDRRTGVVPIGPPRADEGRKHFDALTAGCSAGKPPSCTIQHVVDKKRIKRRDSEGAADFWQLDRKQALGRSGGPLISETGLLLGICSGSSGGSGYFCHVSEIRGFLEHQGLKWLYEDGDSGK